MSRNTYSREFKIEAVRLVTEQGMARRQVARDLGLQVGTLRDWIKQFSEAPEHAFPGHGNVRDEDLHNLRRENALLRMERDILKKAIGIFSQMPPKL
jgi:transposase